MRRPGFFKRLFDQSLPLACGIAFEQGAIEPRIESIRLDPYAEHQGCSVRMQRRAIVERRLLIGRETRSGVSGLSTCRLGRRAAADGWSSTVGG